MALIDVKKNCVLFKYNATPDSTNAVNIRENVFIQPDIKTQEYNEIDGKLANTKSYIDDEHTTASFTLSTKLEGNDKTGAAPETPPAISDLLKSAGLTETVGVDDVTYTINHGTLSSSEVAVYVDGKKRVVDGVVSDFKLSGEVGMCGTAEFTCSGYTDVAETNEANPSITFADKNLIVMQKTSTITIGGTSTKVKSFEFTLNNEIVDIYALTLAQFERSDLDPKISITLYRDSADTIWSQLASQSEVFIDIVLGDGAGKTVQLKIDSALPTNISESDDSGKLSATREFRCVKDATSGEHFELIWK